MQKNARYLLVSMFSLVMVLGSFAKTNNGPDDENPDNDNPIEDFCFGVDLSYINQILDFNGEFRDEGEVRDPSGFLVIMV